VFEKARAILRETPLIDGHNDLPWQFRQRVNNHLGKIDLDADTSTLEPPLHTDIPRLRKGHVGAQFWALYLPSSLEGPGAARVLFEQIDVTRRPSAKARSLACSPSRAATPSRIRLRCCARPSSPAPAT